MLKEQKAKQSSSHERGVKGYLKPSNNKFFNNYVGQYKVSRSEALNDAVKALREKMK